MAVSYGSSREPEVTLAGPFGSVGSSGRITTVTLPAAGWKNGESPYFQTVELASVSESSLPELYPDAQQLERLWDGGTALHLENDGGTVTAWAIGTRPAEDLVLQVILTEVVSA